MLIRHPGTGVRRVDAWITRIQQTVPNSVGRGGAGVHTATNAYLEDMTGCGTYVPRLSHVKPRTEAAAAN